MKPENRKKSHRATSEIPIILDEKFYSVLEHTILQVQWPYNSEHRETFIMRDRALVSFLIATVLIIWLCVNFSVKYFQLGFLSIPLVDKYHLLFIKTSILAHIQFA